MRIRFTKHALSRMKEYDISESEVLADIVPVGKVVQGRRDRKIAQKTVNGHVIGVVYEEAGI
jgi:hypothetical protein